jgi:predicted TIM-barrel fold metal-dependent hydrolase
MEFSQMLQLPIIDCHTHLRHADAEAGARLLAKAAEGGVAAVNVLIDGNLRRTNWNGPALLAKARNPENIYLFAGLDYTFLAADYDLSLARTLPKQIDNLIAMGCDGIKMINGKPNARKAAGIGLDSPVYANYFAHLDAVGLPVLWHVNDPEEFWDPAAAPEWATGPGWIYNESFPTKESLYKEAHHVLEHHPNLTLIFAHFHFLSADLPRLEAMLERYPKLCIDLAPGIEMFHNFTANLDAARDFFLRWQDRIIFGTDLVEDSPTSRIWVTRNCLESDETFHVPTDERLFWPDHRTTLRGLALPKDVLEKIYVGNFTRLAGFRPKPLNMPVVREELQRIATISAVLGEEENSARKVLETIG